MRGIDHPSIVKLHAFSESAEYYYLILERQYSPSLKLFSSELVEIQSWRVGSCSIRL